MPFQTTEILYCLTPADQVERITREGLLPHNDFYADLPAVILAYSKDPLYSFVYEFSKAGFKKQGIPIVRLHIRTANPLYRSLFPNTTYQVISLQPIAPVDIIETEKIS